MRGKEEEGREEVREKKKGDMSTSSGVMKEKKGVVK